MRVAAQLQLAVLNFAHLWSATATACRVRACPFIQFFPARAFASCFIF
jgi:hypothetical protein